MSYDLLVFDASVAPQDREEFLDWYDEITEWEDGPYDNPDRLSPNLRAWFMEAIASYPPMNGPFVRQDVSDEQPTTDYSLAPSLIYITFSWSVAEQAFARTKELAAKHGVGFFNISSDTSDVWVPDGCGGLTLAHQDA